MPSLCSRSDGFHECSRTSQVLQVTAAFPPQKWRKHGWPCPRKSPVLASRCSFHVSAQAFHQTMSWAEPQTVHFFLDWPHPSYISFSPLWLSSASAEEITNWLGKSNGVMRQIPQAQVQSPLQDLAVFPGPVSVENYLGPLYAWKPEESRHDLKAEV